MAMAQSDIRLARTNPADGTQNPYRTRWFQYDGVLFKVDSDRLDGIWRVAVDVDYLIDHTPQVGGTDSYAEVRAFIDSDQNWGVYKVRLSDAREAIAELINSPEWPAVRDAYTARRADTEVVGR